MVKALWGCAFQGVLRHVTDTPEPANRWGGIRIAVWRAPFSTFPPIVQFPPGNVDYNQPNVIKRDRPARGLSPFLGLVLAAASQ